MRGPLPVDALSEKLPRGRGRNWEMTKTRRRFAAAAVFSICILKERELIKITSNFSSPANQGALCRQGRFEYAYLNQPKRLKTPLLKQGGAWTEVPWEKALDPGRKNQNPDKATWAGIIGPDAFAGPDQRGGLSLNLPLSRDTPHRPRRRRSWAPVQEILTRQLGLSGMTNPTGDLFNSSGIILSGSQLMETHPIVGIKVRQAVQKGARLLVIDQTPRTFRRQA